MIQITLSTDPNSSKTITAAEVSVRPVIDASGVLCGDILSDIDVIEEPEVSVTSLFVRRDGIAASFVGDDEQEFRLLLKTMYYYLSTTDLYPSVRGRLLAMLADDELKSNTWSKFGDDQLFYAPKIAYALALGITEPAQVAPGFSLSNLQFQVAVALYLDEVEASKRFARKPSLPLQCNKVRNVPQAELKGARWLVNECQLPIETTLFLAKHVSAAGWRIFDVPELVALWRASDLSLGDCIQLIEAVAKNRGTIDRLVELLQFSLQNGVEDFRYLLDLAYEDAEMASYKEDMRPRPDDDQDGDILAGIRR